MKYIIINKKANPTLPNRFLLIKGDFRTLTTLANCTKFNTWNEAVETIEYLKSIQLEQANSLIVCRST